jgi:hypothetical protein
VVVAHYKEFLVDHLRDNLSDDISQVLQRGFDAAVIDGISDVLIGHALEAATLTAPLKGRMVLGGRITVPSYFQQYRQVSGVGLSSTDDARELAEVYDMAALSSPADNRWSRHARPSRGDAGRRHREERRAIEAIEDEHRGEYVRRRTRTWDPADAELQRVEMAERAVDAHLQRHPDPGELLSALSALYPSGLKEQNLRLPQRRATVLADLDAAYAEKIRAVGADRLGAQLPKIMRAVLDKAWREHLEDLDTSYDRTDSATSFGEVLRQHASAAEALWQARLTRIDIDVIGYLFRARP